MEAAYNSLAVAFIQELSSLKRKIELVNKELETEVEQNKELDAEIARQLDSEREALSEREQWKKTLIQTEVQHMDLEALTQATTETVGQVTESLKQLRKKRDELQKAVEDERDAFVETCKLFQRHQHEAAEDEDGLKLMERKCNLLSEVASLEKSDHISKLILEVQSRNKVHELKELQNTNEVLQVQLEEENTLRSKLWKRTEGLEYTLATIKANEIPSRFQDEINDIQEIKKLTEDEIRPLKQQMLVILNEEQGIGKQLQEQKQVLYRLERSLYEAQNAQMQDTYINQARNSERAAQYAGGTTFQGGGNTQYAGGTTFQGGEIRSMQEGQPVRAEEISL